MKNDFTNVMFGKTDEELIKIVTLNRGKYQEEAVKAAEHEIDLRNIDASRFEEISSKINVNEKITKEIENNSVRSIVRFANFVIDFMVIFILYAIIVPTIESILPLTNRVELSIYRMGSLILFIAFYYISFEHNSQKTLGKMITKTKVVTLDGNKPELMDIVSRTFCRLIPFDRFSFFFTRNGFHDAISGTKVIKDNV